jgi:hypothetical protein
MRVHQENNPYMFAVSYIFVFVAFVRSTKQEGVFNLVLATTTGLFLYWTVLFNILTNCLTFETSRDILRLSSLAKSTTTVVFVDV